MSSHSSGNSFLPSFQESHATESPSPPSTQNSSLSNSSRRSNRGSRSTETEPCARNDASTQDIQRSHYTQYVANMLNSPSMLIPMPTTSNQATPGQAARLSLQGSFQPPGHFYNHHAQRVLEEHLALAENDLKKAKEEVVNLKKKNAMLRREAEAYKNLYDALKEEKDGGREDVMKRSP